MVAVSSSRPGGRCSPRAWPMASSEASTSRSPPAVGGGAPQPPGARPAPGAGPRRARGRGAARAPAPSRAARGRWRSTSASAAAARRRGRRRRRRARRPSSSSPTSGDISAKRGVPGRARHVRVVRCGRPRREGCGEGGAAEPPAPAGGGLRLPPAGHRPGRAAVVGWSSSGSAPNVATYSSSTISSAVRDDDSSTLTRPAERHERGVQAGAPVRRGHAARERQLVGEPGEVDACRGPRSRRGARGAPGWRAPGPTAWAAHAGESTRCALGERSPARTRPTGSPSRCGRCGRRRRWRSARCRRRRTGSSRRRAGSRVPRAPCPAGARAISPLAHHREQHVERLLGDPVELLEVEQRRRRACASSSGPSTNTSGR